MNAVWRMPRHPTYEHHLCRFMTFVHNQPFERYPKGTTFSQEQLLQIKPEHVHNWLRMLAFGKVDFSIDAGDRPTKIRCSSLKMQKEQLSFLCLTMPPLGAKAATTQPNTLCIQHSSKPSKNWMFVV